MTGNTKSIWYSLNQIIISHNYKRLGNSYLSITFIIRPWFSRISCTRWRHTKWHINLDKKVRNSIKSYQIVEEMYNFAIYTELAQGLVIGPVNKKKRTPHPALGIGNHLAPDILLPTEFLMYDVNSLAPIRCKDF